MSNESAVRHQASVWAVGLGLAMAACSGRVDVGVEPEGQGAVSAGGLSSGGSGGTAGSNTAGSAAMAGNGATGTGDAGSPNLCGFAPTQVGMDPRPLLSSAEVLARIFQFLENDPTIPAGKLPDEPTPSWAAARAKGILDLHEAAGTPAPGLTRFLERWLRVEPDELEAPAIWAQKLVNSDATLPTLLSEPTGGNRVGILNEAEVLATHPTISRRGSLINTNVLCQPIPAPPANHPLDLPPVDGLTHREQQELSVGSSPACASCHQLSDRAGYSLEHFDAAGEYRELDNGKPVDASGTLVSPAYSFKDYPEFAVQLAGSCQVAHCMTTLLGRHAFGNQLWSDEAQPLSEAEINRIALDFASSGFSIRALVDGIVRSPSFLR